MARHPITLVLNLSDRASKVYKDAVYKHNDRFLVELQAVIEDCLECQKLVDINALVIDIAEQCDIQEYAFAEEQRRDWELTVAAAM